MRYGRRASDWTHTGAMESISPAMRWAPDTAEVADLSAVPEVDEPLGCLSVECLKSSSNVMIARKQGEGT